MELHYCDLDDRTCLRRLLISVQPDEIYHLAGQSHVGISFEIPESTCEYTAMGTLSLLEIVRDLPRSVRFINVGSSEIFGRPSTSPQDEWTPKRPTSPYGVAKAFAVDMVRVYREAMHLHASNVICYNHESPRRGESFVTRKICRAAARIAAGSKDRLRLGNIHSKRDWGFAGDYVMAMWLAAQQPHPDDYVIATGHARAVSEFGEQAFGVCGLSFYDHVDIDSSLFRPNEPIDLVGDSTHAREVLGWSPTVPFHQLVKMMVDAELATVAATNCGGQRLELSPRLTGNF
jgi:GDPmannose 4,6-dehydratase